VRLDAVTPSPAERFTRRSFVALLVALGVDNAGSGLFLPLVLVYSTEAVGLSLAVAGTVVSVGTAIGLLVPAVAGRVVDRLGPKAVVVSSQVLQAGGLLAYLLAQDVIGVAVAAVSVTVGLQLFYSALFALIADAAPPGPRDHAFAVVDMVRAGAFGAGALVAGALLTALGTTGLRVAVALDAATFVLAALLLVLSVHPRHHSTDGGSHGGNGGGSLETVPPQEPPPRGVLRDRPFSVLILATGLIGSASDVFLIGLPVLALDQLEAPGWVPGLCLALLTLAVSTLAAAVVRATAGYSRLRVIAIGGGVTLLWCAVTASALAVPSTWVPAWLLASTLVLAASSLLIGTRPNAVAEAAAPAQLRGRYLAVFQYAFTAPQLAAPLVIALSAVHPVLPWATTAATTTAGLGLLPWLARRLPIHAVHPSG
jgi:Na+/melibiose symporter-like transporter